jgi:hypothetical protein
VPIALNTPCVATNYRRSVAGIACLLFALGVMVIPHALVAFAPNALAQIPSLLSGFPVPDLVIRWNLMLFYPFTILHFIAPVNAPPWMYFDLFHCAVGAAGVYLATLRWSGNAWMAMAMAAFTLPFAGSEFVSSNAMAALAWTPWLLLLAESAFTSGGRDLVLCGALAAIQLLAGSLEVVVLTWLCVAICASSVFARSSFTVSLHVKRFGAFALLAFLLAATQVVPLLDVPARLEIRPGGVDVDVEHQNRPVLVQTDHWLA